MDGEPQPVPTTDSPRLAQPPGGPDWARIDFAVPCLRCGADLRGQSQPVCQNCGFRFSRERVLRRHLNLPHGAAVALICLLIGFLCGFGVVSWYPLSGV